MVVGLALVASPVVARAGHEEVVLGKKGLTGRYGIGWGTPHPSLIYNGGVPSGKAWNLHWFNWGSSSAIAHGLTWIYRPNGSYYGKPAAIELRAYRLGQCRSEGSLAAQHRVASFRSGLFVPATGAVRPPDCSVGRGVG